MPITEQEKTLDSYQRVFPVYIAMARSAKSKATLCATTKAGQTGKSAWRIYRQCRQQDTERRRAEKKARRQASTEQAN